MMAADLELLAVVVDGDDRDLLREQQLDRERPQDAAGPAEQQHDRAVRHADGDRRQRLAREREVLACDTRAIARQALDEHAAIDAAERELGVGL